MKVLGHEYVSVDAEVVFSSGFLEDPQENALGTVIVEKWTAMVTTAGDEV
jgi:hypothetical protein